MRKPRSECTERQLDLAVTRLIDGTYKSASKAIIAMGINISPQGLLKRRRKIEALAIDSAISPAPKEAQAPTERDRIEALKEASRRVECAQKNHGNKRKKTASIICEMKAEYPGAALLSMSNANRHVQIGRAGQSPAKAKKPRILSPEGESALVKYVLEADAMMLPLNQDELKDAYSTSMGRQGPDHDLPEAQHFLRYPRRRSRDLWYYAAPSAREYCKPYAVS